MCTCIVFNIRKTIFCFHTKCFRFRLSYDLPIENRVFVLIFFVYFMIIIYFIMYFTCFGILCSAYSDKSGCSIASGSSSIGANSTATLSGNEYHSLTVSDEFPSDNLHIDFATNYGKKLKRNRFL